MDPRQVNHTRSISSGSFTTAPTQDFSATSEDQSSPLPPSVGLGVPLNSQLNHPSFDSSIFASSSNPMASQAPVNSTVSFTQASQTSAFCAADYTDPDFSLFPPGVAPADAPFDQPLFDQSLATGMASPQMNPSSPTTANLLKPEGHASPAMLPNQFSSPPASHSRNASLGPADALFPGQQDWSRVATFQHRRTPSEYSDVSSVAHSPLLPLESSFDNPLEHGGHSPMHTAMDMSGIFGDMDVRISNLNFSDAQHSPGIMAGRSPSHSPAMSPRLMPVPGSADLHSPANFGMLASTPAYQQPFTPLPTSEAFPTLTNQAMDMSQMAPPAINIQLAPAPKPFEGSQTLNSASLTPPERGRTRPRSVTDPYNAQMRSGNSLSPNIAASMSRDASRSASPGSRASSVASNRRRQSTSSVPNNVIALRLADPEYHPPENGNTRRVQKHPATFQCTLCPKRFTRAYNLRSHLRTHTDERPFVCTVCGKAFARQHDRKRHESLHSGEKKFVCKGELKNGNTWGCSRRFARADALGRHFRSEAGRVCIKPLLEEEALERQRVWQEQQMAQNISQSMGQSPQMVGPDGYPMDATGGYAFPQALLAQYPALAQVNWSQPGPSIEDDFSGRSSFDNSDYEEAEDPGYVSGPGTGFGDGNVANGYGDMNYASDYGQPEPNQ